MTGDDLKELRAALGVSFKQLGDAAGRSGVSVLRAEQTKSIGAELAQRYLSALSRLADERDARAREQLAAVKTARVRIRRLMREVGG